MNEKESLKLRDATEYDEYRPLIEEIKDRCREILEMKISFVCF